MMAKTERTAPNEQRAAARFAARLPVEIEGAEGRTRDISDTGVYVETQDIRDFGPMVQLTLSYQDQGEWRSATCDAQVVRVEAHDDCLGIAARLTAPLFDHTESVELGVARRR